MIIVTTLAPVFLLVALGAVLQKYRFWSRDFIGDANALAYWIALPVFLFHSLATASRNFDTARPMFTAFFITTGLVIALAYLTARFLHLPTESIGTFVQGAFRGNLAYAGLPILFALHDSSPAAISARTASLLATGPMMIIYNLVSVTALVASQHKLGSAMFKSALREIVINPLILAIVAGGLWNWAGWTLPVWANQTLEPLGAMASPLALLCIGAGLVAIPLAGAWRAIASAAALKALICPLLGLFVGHLLGFGAAELRALVVMLATPTAAASYTMTVKLGGDAAIASGTIALSVLMSVISLALTVGFL